MIVYRLEDKEGTKIPFDNVGSGVYSGSHMAYAVATTSDDTQHPSPQWDANLGEYFNSDYVCCFDSVFALRRWFDLLEGASEGVFNRLQIATYKVPDDEFHLGRYQAIALTTNMILIETHNIDFRG